MTSSGSWLITPGNAAATPWLTVRASRTVLVVAPHITACSALLDVVQVLRRDRRVQVLFSIPSTNDLWPGVNEYLQQEGCLVIPWHQALETKFDLALAASFRELHNIAAPILKVTHGLGVVGRKNGPRIHGRQNTAHGLDREMLVRDGRIIPASLVLTHDNEVELLRESCPEALGRSVVAGDLSFDRVLDCLPLREHYRQTFDLTPQQKLVLISSTWSPSSIFGSESELFQSVSTNSPTTDNFRFVAALHPLIWTLHGTWQVKAWLEDYLKAGNYLIAPGEAWRSALVAADVVIGDHGSIPVYGAAIGKPVILNSTSETDEKTDDIAAIMRTRCPRLDLSEHLTLGITSAIESDVPSWHQEVADLVTSNPGGAGAVIRTEIYKLLSLTEPETGICLPPARSPQIIGY
jgi:hypothetical protein